MGVEAQDVNPDAHDVHCVVHEIDGEPGRFSDGG